MRLGVLNAQQMHLKEQKWRKPCRPSAVVPETGRAQGAGYASGFLIQRTRPNGAGNRSRALIATESVPPKEEAGEEAESESGSSSDDENCAGERFLSLFLSFRGWLVQLTL